MRRLAIFGVPWLVVAALAGREALATDRDAGAPEAGAAATKNATADVTIPSLLARFRGLPGVSATFREEKRIQILDEPLVSEGTIDFAPPGRFARRVTVPSPSMVLVNGATLSFWDGRATESIDLGSNPTVRLFVDSFLNILAGDLKALEAAWRLTLNRTKSGWTIVLVPSTAPIAKVVREMRLEGHGTQIDSMKLVEASGDETVTRFANVDTARKYSDAEVNRIFRLPTQ